MTKVSVIMPCYNDGAYLLDSIASVNKQTYPDIELILIDDGSTDLKTLKIIDGLDLPNLQCLHSNHVGPSEARNIGIRAAKGDYILPLDADDIIEPSYIEKAVAVLDQQPQVGIVYCLADRFGEERGSWELARYSLESMLLDNVIFVTALFRKADWERVGGFCADFHHGMEDYDFFLSLLQIGRGVYQIPETLFHYRAKSTSRSTNFMENYQAIQSTYVMLYQRHKPLYEQHMDIYCLALRRELIHQRADARKASVPTFRQWLGMRMPRTKALVKRGMRAARKR